MCVVAAIVQYLPCGPVIIVVLQRFAEDPLIVSDLVYLDDTPKGEDDRLKKERTLEMVRRAVWGMLYADDAGVVSKSPRGLTRMMGVIVVACQELSNALRIEATGQRYKQTTEFVYLGGAISERAQTLTPRLSVTSAPLGRVSGNTVPNCTTDGTPGCRSRSGCSKRR